MTKVRERLLWTNPGLVDWYIDECNRQLNDAKFCRQLDGDITDAIQQRVTVYIEYISNDGYIDEKTKKYPVQTNVRLGRFPILPKYIKREILDVP